MTGGYHSRRQRDRDRTLADRVTPTAHPDPPVTPDPPRPCWIRWPADDPLPGHVLGWHRGADGTWWALVVASLPEGAVAPRVDES